MNIEKKEEKPTVVPETKEELAEEEDDFEDFEIETHFVKNLSIQKKPESTW